MKLLLTSSGITNPTIHQGLEDLLGKPVEECKALFIPTAIHPFANGPYYAAKAIQSPITQLGWKSLGILELTSLPSIEKQAWKITVEEADAILVWGGDPVYLAYWLKRSGVTDLLSDQVYVGI